MSTSRGCVANYGVCPCLRWPLGVLTWMPSAGGKVKKRGSCRYLLGMLSLLLRHNLCHPPCSTSGEPNAALEGFTFECCTERGRTDTHASSKAPMSNSPLQSPTKPRKPRRPELEVHVIFFSKNAGFGQLGDGKICWGYVVPA